MEDIWPARLLYPWTLHNNQCIIGHLKHNMNSSQNSLENILWMHLLYLSESSQFSDDILLSEASK